jgi:hypothetical protein
MRKILVPAIALLFAASMFAAHSGHTYADPRDFQVMNSNPSLGVTLLLVDVSGPGMWDPSTDLLKGSPLAPGQGGTVVFDPNIDPGQCVYDLQATYSDGSTREFDQLNLCTTLSVTIS